MVVVEEGESGRPHVGFLHCLLEGYGGRIPRVLEGLENDYRVSMPGKNHGARRKGAKHSNAVPTGTMEDGGIRNVQVTYKGSSHPQRTNS